MFGASTDLRLGSKLGPPRPDTSRGSRENLTGKVRAEGIQKTAYGRFFCGLSWRIRMQRTALGIVMAM